MAFWDIGENFAKGAAETFVGAGNVGITNSQELLGKGLQEFNPAIYQLMETIHRSAFLPVAGAILCVSAFTEVYSILVSKNEGNDGYVLDSIKYLIKFIITLWLITQAFNIVNFIFNIGGAVTREILAVVGIDGSNKPFDLTGVNTMIESLDNWQAFGMGIILYIMAIVIFFVGVYSYIFVLSWLYECYLFISASPIPMGAYLSEEHKSMTTNYIKDIIALALQGGMFIVVFAVYKAMMSTVDLSGISSNSFWAVLLSIVAPPFLMMTMYGKMGTLSKQIVGK